MSSVDWWLQGTHVLDSPGFDWTRSVTSPDGNVHLFGGDNSGTTGPVFPMRSLDSTGLLEPDDKTLILPNGTRYSYPNNGQQTGGPPSAFKEGVQPSTITDANGNQISIGSTGWTDTMGRLIPGQIPANTFPVQPGNPTSDLSTCPSGTTSAWVWNVPGPAGVNGGIRTFKFCYANLNLGSTTFGVQGVNEGSALGPFLTAVVLPDLTMWTFAYDNFADVTRLGLPTGGSISYTYQAGPTNCNTGWDTSTSMWVASRTVDANDGTGGHTWSYAFHTPANVLYAAGGTVTVTGPDLNDTVHTMGVAVSGSACSGYVAQTQHFQGSAGSGTLLETVQTQYSGTSSVPGGPFSGIAFNVVPTQVTISLPGGQTGKVVSQYDPLTQEGNNQMVLVGSLLQKDEYDYSKTLVRSTLNHYLWQDNATYLSNNFVRLLSSSTLKDGGGNQVAQTTYAYDQYGSSGKPISSGITTSLVAPPAGEPTRGNPTTVSHWLDTAGSLLSSTATYFDTGMKATSTPPVNADGLNRTTTYTYDPTFQGAYLTQTNLPDTKMPDAGATTVHHVIQGSYDFNTGLLTSFADENGQSFTYTYDDMLRLTQGNHPDGGITKFNYPDPNTVERQRLITGSTYDDYKVKFDGLGRAYQTQQLTPDCTSYIKVDTTYDSLGRTASVSNPYCLTNEATYGITQTQYDALSRVTKTIEQDGSASTVKYNDAAGDGAGSSVVCTTATDEAGKPREACNDGLGRMVKVLEPNPGAAATFGTGSVTISGNEQTANSQPATSGQGSLTITGSEQKACFNPSRCNPTTGPWIYDTGTVTIAVGSYPAKTVNYGRADAPNTIAYALSCAFHNDANSPVDAPCPASAGSSTSVNFTARATGASTNYSFTSSSATSDTSCNNFCSASFSIAPASGALTGGQNASSTPDTGTITVSLAGTPYQTNFGAGDNTTSIAGRLATAISAGACASATNSGGTINLTAKTAGTAGQCSLSAAYTWNSSQFTNPSFTTSTSGAALGGAKDASALNNNPYVTTYQYNARSDMLCVHQKATDTTPDVACTGTTAPTVPAAWRQRFFTYDSFSRILTAMNPETNGTGSTNFSYVYDADGNVTSKTEPAPNQAWGSSSTVTITYTYDALNRLLDTTYSDGTTQSNSHRYDYSSFLGQTFAYPIGREVAATAANNTIEYFTSYDQMGRVAQTVQCNPGVSPCKTFTAGYGPVGQLLTLGYPGNSFTVTYGYDAAARLTSATDSNGVVYAQNPTFIASGAIQEFTAPNFNNNKYHTAYNNRLQPTEIWTGSAQGTSALFDKQYQYNPPGLSQTNNGNIYTVTNVIDGTHTQTFTYDPLNRLISAGDQAHWSNTYTYDPWGNLTNKNPGSPAGENLQKSADSNNHLSGLTYDAGGNEINDGSGNTFFYDAENRITSTAGSTYTYDADGRRVKKSSGTNYWYGPTGAALAETDSSGNWTYYIFFGGQRLARNIPQPSPNPADVKYYITDHLHSTAMFVDKAGTAAAILDDNDFYPWGGVVPGIGKSTSNNTVKFTGQYRDTESNLDYFGARYHANTNGRFMSPDWATRPTSVPYAVFGDPQSLNLYAFVRNGPIARVDADGHMIVGFSATGDPMYVRGAGVGGDPMANGDNPYDEADRNFIHDYTVIGGYDFADPNGSGEESGGGGSGAENGPVQAQNQAPFNPTVTYDNHLSAKDSAADQSKVGGAVGLINANWSKLSDQEKATVENIKSIDVSGSAQRSYVQESTGTLTLTQDYVSKSSKAWLASAIGHDGEHVALFKSGGIGASRGVPAELKAMQFQLQVGMKFGLTATETKYLQGLIQNPSQLQQYIDTPP